MFSMKAIVCLQGMLCVDVVQFTGNFSIVFCCQCGQPYYEDNCRTCGARIGGQNHTLVAGNAQIAELVYVSLFDGLRFL